MEKKLEKRINNFQNLPDGEKLAILVEVSSHLDSKNIIDFLYNVIEKEKYEKIRIKALMILKTCDNEKTLQKLKELYAYEREKSVRLALVEVLANLTQEQVDESLQDISSTDENDVIRSMALKNLHERKKISKTKMKSLLLDVIQNDPSVFPKQLALNLISSYADKKTLETLKMIYSREIKFKMKQLLYRTLNEVAEKVNLELDIAEPIEEKRLDEGKKKGRRRRRKKREKEEEEHLFF
ncbi:MAG: HEAT repeat domain-containing protein [Candidatus Heimdallarchaeota archaeon]